MINTENTLITDLNHLCYVLGNPRSVDLVSAVRDACLHYSMTKTDRQVFTRNHNKFTLQDFMLYVPNDICKHHQIKKNPEAPTHLVANWAALVAEKAYKPVNYETLLPSITPDNVYELLEGHWKCGCCTNQYWDGGQSYCHCRINDSTCEEGINEWLNADTQDIPELLRIFGKKFWDIPLAYYEPVYQIMSDLATWNEENIPEKDRIVITENTYFCNPNTVYSCNPKAASPNAVYAYYKYIAKETTGSTNVKDVLVCIQKDIKSEEIKGRIQAFLEQSA